VKSVVWSLIRATLIRLLSTASVTPSALTCNTPAPAKLKSQDTPEEMVERHGENLFQGGRKRIGPDLYEGLCGCIFNGNGTRVQWCGDHY
jgi:hypothetical protein